MLRKDDPLKGCPDKHLGPAVSLLRAVMWRSYTDPEVSDEHKFFTYKGRKYWWRPQPMFYEFNKDILKGGRFLLRSDDDFYIEANLPPEFSSLPLPVLINILWGGAPWLNEVEYRPDVVYENLAHLKKANGG